MIPVKHYVIVGSYALGTRPYNDIDIVCYRKDIECEVKSENDYIVTLDLPGKKIECLLADNMPSLAELLERYNTGQKISTKDQLWMKAGHLHIPNRNWRKHMNDFNVLRKLLENSINKKDFLNNSLLRSKIKKYRKETNQHAKSHQMKLKGVSKKDFFDDAVKKFYDHDYIHEQVAHKEKPMYSYMQKDETVQCHKDLWDKFTHEEKIWCVQEESMVIGLERFLIPQSEAKRKLIPYQVAFERGVEKVCTTLSSGWFRDFCHMNYIEICSTVDLIKMENFINKHYG